MKRILVVGELNVDLVMGGLPSLPVLGKELLGDSFQMTLGSSSAITSAKLAALGASVDFMGLIGDDGLGHFLLHQLAAYGVGTEHIRAVPGVSTDVTIVLTYPRDRALLTHAGLMTTFDGGAITTDLLKNYTHLHVGSFFLQTNLQAMLPQIFREAHKLGLSTSLDTGWDPQEKWMHNSHLASTLAVTDFFLPNEVEATALSGDHWPPTALFSAMKGALIVKRGAEGAWALADLGDIPLVMPALPVDVVDTTGAGDAFNAGFIYASVIEGAALPVALRFAVACGVQAVTQMGGATNAPTAEEIYRRFYGE